MKNYLGIDLGGTQVRVAVVDEAGVIHQVETASSMSQESSDVIIENLCTQIDKIDLSNISGIGIGVPGPVDQVNGWMNIASNIPALAKVPIVKILEDRYHLPVYMDNDANVAALAEATVGVGKGEPIVCYVTHSTGIGAGIVINGQTVSGKHGYAGEIANLIVDDSAPKMNHLNAGSVENLAAGVGLVKQAQERLNPNITSGKELFDLAREGNSVANEIVDKMCFNFGKALSMLTAVLDPHCVIIGGGVTHSSDFYFKKLTEYYNSMVHEGLRDMEFKKPTLKEPGIVGAAMLPKSYGK